jgi:hypothetical protein
MFFQCLFFAFIYVYWCPTRLPCQTMFVLLNSNMTDATSLFVGFVHEAIQVTSCVVKNAVYNIDITQLIIYQVKSIPKGPSLRICLRDPRDVYV